MLVILAILSLGVFLMPVRWKSLYTLAVVALGALVCACEAIAAFSAGYQPVSYELSRSVLFGYDYPVVDWLSAIFMIIISIAAVSVTIYSREYIARDTKRRSPAQLSLHYASLAVMFYAMIFVVVFRGAFAFLMSWEMMTIASFFLILFDGDKREVRRAAINYLILMHIGFVFILAAFVVTGEGSLMGGFDSLTDYFSTHSPVVVFILFFIGFGMKAGVFPLHVWLPEAHPAAPSHVSALMSGVMIKMGVYGVLRVLSYITADLFTIGLIILLTGIVSALWGAILAALQSNLKKLLAYSSIENIGIIFIGIGIGTVGMSSGNPTLALLALSGALLHTVNHSMFKSVLFMSAGSVHRAAHTLNIDELGGLSRNMPVTSLFFLVGSLAICALPPFNGFISEFLIYLGLIDNIGIGDSDVLLSVISMASIAVVGGIVVLVFCKAFGISFLGSPRCCKSAEAREVGVWMLAGQLLPLAGIVVIGISPLFVVEGVMNVVSNLYILPIPAELSVSIGTSGLYISIGAAILIIISSGLFYYKRRVQQGRILKKSPTWGCGFTAPTAKMQYTGESFAEGVQQIGGSIINSRGSSGEVSKDEIFPKPHSFKVERQDKLDGLLSSRWLMLLRKINGRLALFQTGKINHYILHALLFLALILLLTLLKAL